MEKKYWKSQGKVREFCHPGKVGTLTNQLMYLSFGIYVKSLEAEYNK